jgi:hypothetical protein
MTMLTWETVNGRFETDLPTTELVSGTLGARSSRLAEARVGTPLT